MTTWELSAEFDIAESGILPWSVEELIELLPEAERDQTRRGLLSMRQGYSEARGSAALRTALAATYRDTTPDQILVTTGAIEANFLLFNVLLSPGDHVVAMFPAYQQLYSVPAALGCAVDHWRVRADETGFWFSVDDLANLIRPNTRLIVINTPHNPTGATLSAAEVRRVYDLAAAAGARVLSDEAYRWLEVPGAEPLAAPTRDLGDAGISVGTFSKPFGLPGLRLGWLAAPADFARQGWWLRDYVSLSPAKLSDAIGQLALRLRPSMLARNRTIITENLTFANQWFADNADIAAWSAPRGGLLTLLRYRLDIPSSRLADHLAGEYGVMLAPGSAFDFEYHLRIGIGQQPAVFAAGLRRFGRCCRDLLAAGVTRRG